MSGELGLVRFGGSQQALDGIGFPVELDTVRRQRIGCGTAFHHGRWLWGSLRFDGKGSLPFAMRS